MLKLYDYWRSTASFRVRMALAYKNIPYETIAVHLVNNCGEQHSQTYKSMNPSELVPTLALPDGNHISQSLAIIMYLNDTWPQPGLVPESGIEKYKALDIAGIIGSDLHPLNNLRVLQYLQKNMGMKDEQKNQWYAHWVEKGFAAVEAKLQQSPEQSGYAIGKSLTIADIFILAQIYNAERFHIPFKHYKRINCIYQHCKEQSWHTRAYPRDGESQEKDGSALPSS